MNEILPPATKWMDLVSIRLTEISHSENTKYHIISLIYRISETKQTKKWVGGGSPNNRLLTLENKLMVTRVEVGEENR